MSHLYWQCQKHKHFCFSNVRFRRGSIVKSVCLVMVVAVSLHHQQTDNFCKIQKKNSKWTWAVIYVWRFIVLSSGHPSKCVCYSALRARGACPLKGYCLLNLFTWSTLNGILFVRDTGWNWTAGRVTTSCLVARLRLWQPWHTVRTSLNWTDVTWYTRFVTISINNQFGYFAGRQQPWPLASWTHVKCKRFPIGDL